MPGEADLNLYAYVSGEVLKNIDPHGLEPRTANDVMVGQRQAAEDKERRTTGEIVVVDPRDAAWRNARLSAAVFSETLYLNEVYGEKKGARYWEERSALLEHAEALMEQRAQGELYQSEFKVAAAYYAARMFGQGYSYQLTYDGNVVELEPPMQEAGKSKTAIPLNPPRPIQSRQPLGPLNEAEGAGAYRRVGGHHVMQDAAFRGAANYTRGSGFSISQEFMQKRGWDHDAMSTAQRRLQDGLAASGRPNTMAQQSRIARQALVAGGATRAEAAAVVRAALAKFRTDGVPGPTRIPGAGR